jgi:hypothetical protein
VSRQLPTVTVYEGEDVPVVDRVYRTPDALILVANVASITLRIFDRETVGFIHEEDITPGDAFSDVLRTDAWWTRDGTGYNFRHIYRPEDTIMVASMRLDGGHRYRFEYRVEEVDGRVHYIVQPVVVKSTLTVT